MARARGRTDRRGLIRAARERAGLTMPEAAARVPCSVRHLGALERGERPITTALLPAVAAAVEMTAQEREALHMMVLGLAPAAGPDPARRVPRLVRLIGRLPVPAYLLDVSMTMVAANEMAIEAYSFALAPGARRPNLISDVLLHERAPEHLLHWERDWIVPAVQYVWTRYRARPEDPRLQAATAALAGDERLRRVWLRREELGPLVYPDMLRSVRHPQWGLKRIAVNSLLPWPVAAETHGVLIMWDLLD